MTHTYMQLRVMQTNQKRAQNSVHFPIVKMICPCKKSTGAANQQSPTAAKIILAICDTEKPRLPVGCIMMNADDNDKLRKLIIIYKTFGHLFSFFLSLFTLHSSHDSKNEIIHRITVRYISMMGVCLICINELIVQLACNSQ